MTCGSWCRRRPCTDPADLSCAEREAYADAAVAQAAELARNGDLDAARAVSLLPPEPQGMRERAPWESVIAAAMDRDEPMGTATEALRAAHEYPVHTRHLYELAEAFWWKDVAPQIDDMVRQRIRWDDYQRYLNDPARPAFLQELRRHEIGGRRSRGRAGLDHRDPARRCPVRRRRAARAGGKRTRPGPGRDNGLG